MHFSWNETKSRLNKEKHGLSFDLAKDVFQDSYLLSWMDNRFDYYNEERWIGLGCIDDSLVIVVVHTFRSEEDGQEVIRIISARKATQKEQKTYFQYRK